MSILDDMTPWQWRIHVTSKGGVRMCIAHSQEEYEQRIEEISDREAKVIVGRMYSEAEIRRAEEARAIQGVPNLRERLDEAYDASLNSDHHDCRAILSECIRLLDAAPQPPVAEPSVNDAFVRQLKTAVDSFDFFLNEPWEYDEPQKVRSYRYAAYKKWADVVSALQNIERAEAAKKGT